MFEVIEDTIIDVVKLIPFLFIIFNRNLHPIWMVILDYRLD